MKRLAFAFFFLATLGAAVGAQSNRASRPRVVPTPTPTPEISESEPIRERSERGAPVLAGDRRSTGSPQPAATPPRRADDDDEVIRVETNLVTMPVSVLDRNGRFISGLAQRDFKVFENGVEQEIGFFQSVEQPFTVVLMIDVSPSTAYQIDEIHSAAIAFVEQLRPNDRVMVVAFDQEVKILARPTNDRNLLRAAIRQAQFGNGTSLYSAINQLLERELDRIEGRKAIVLFTDGVDTTSRRATYDSSIRDAEETDVLIYPIRYNTFRDYGRGGGMPQGTGTGRRGGWGDIIGIILGGGIQIGSRRGGAGTSAEEYARGKQYLETLAQNSGGRAFEADTLYNLEAAFSGIAEELRRQYSIGYYPDASGQPGERRQVRVRVMRPNVVVRARSSYIVGQSSARQSGS